MLPFSGSSVSVNALLSMSATVKFTKALLMPVFTAVTTLGTPLIVGASFTAATLIATATALAELKPPLSIALTWNAPDTGVPFRLATGVHTAGLSVLINLLVLPFQALPPIVNDPFAVSTVVTSKAVTLPLLSAPLLAASRSAKLIERA